MKRLHSLLIIAVSLILFLLIDARQVQPLLSAPTAAYTVKAAWQHANDIGVYQYRTQARQFTRPLPLLSNMGRTTQEAMLYVEGELDRSAETMQMKLWSDEAGVTNVDRALEIKVADGSAEGRMGDGEWEDVGEVTDFFAPDGDPLGYLVAAKNIELVAQEERQLPVTLNGEDSVRFTRYQFEIDGLTYARHMRNMMERSLREKGELPASVHLDSSRVYADMTGTGELWLDAAGLPLRQEIQLQFPPQGEYEIEAVIHTDFFGWQPDVAQTTPLHLTQLSSGQGGMTALANIGTLLLDVSQQITPTLIILLSMILFVRLVVHYWNSTKLYKWVAFTMLFCLVVVPLLENQQLFAFFEKQKVEQAKHEADIAARRAAQDAHWTQYSTTFDPQQNPLNASLSMSPVAIAEQLTTTTNPTGYPRHIMAFAGKETQQTADLDNDGVLDVLEYALGTNPLQADSDGDGLSDGVELYQLATDPIAADSDGDTLSDGIEVRGFQDAQGKQWYLNPLDVDTNLDGYPDNLECPQGVCPDTDGDGTPDGFDTDDDNDKVPDSVDLSRTSMVRVKGIQNWQREQPDYLAAFRVNNLQPSTTAFVDIQLLPAEPNHLGYAFNALTWPVDYEGQVQVHNDIYWNLPGGQGNMQVIPMLEINMQDIRGTFYGNLPVKPGAPPIQPGVTQLSEWLDTDELGKYGVSVKEGSDFGSYLAYVPITLVRDPIGDGVVAFSARMPYWATGYSNLQTARLIWLVRATVSSPDNPNLIQEETIHTYYEPWTLTGMSVREDHGVETAVLFENPDFAERNPHYDENLWKVADGLSQTFLSGRRDLSVAEVKRRFDSRSNGGVVPEQRWQIPADALQVETISFASMTGLAELPTGRTEQILNTHLKDKVEDATLLFMREETFRSMNLETAVVENNTVTAVNFNLNPAEVKKQVLGGMHWAPYRYKGESMWEAYPIADYWETVSSLYQPLFPNNTPVDAETQTGKIVVAQSYYLSLFQGLNRIVESGGIATDIMPPSDDNLDYTLYNSKGMIGEIVGRVTNEAIKGIMREEIRQSFNTVSKLTVKQNFFGALEGITGKDGDFSKKLESLRKLLNGEGWSKKMKGGVAIAIIGAIAGLSALIALTVTGNIKVKRAIDITLNTVYLTLAVYGIIDAVKNAIKGVSKAVAAAGKIAGVISLIVVATLQVGIFLYSFISGAFKFGSVAFLEAVAQLTAMIAYALIMFAIGVIPIVGQIIVAVLALVDALIFAICAIIGSSGGFCQGLSGRIMAGLAAFFYSNTVYVDMYHKDRLDIQNFDMTLKRPVDGMVTDNILKPSVETISRLYLSGEGGAFLALGYEDSEMYRDIYRKRHDDLNVSNFRYQLQVTPASDKWDIHENMYWFNGPAPYWYLNSQGIYEGKFNAGGSTSLPQPGINVLLPPIYLAEGYALKTEECALLAVCSDSVERGTNHYELTSNLKLDIFPKYFSAFYSLDGAAGQWRSYHLQWGTSWGGTVAFPLLEDADGDGLRSEAFFGNDPNDSTYDYDLDGLSDYYEVENNLPYDKKDEDADGLDDYQEVRYRTNPRLRDTDGDGLTDKQEIDGWLFEYTPGSYTQVTSDPLLVDTDQDGQTDLQESLYQSNPRAPGSGGRVKVTSLAIYPEIVAPGQEINYTTVVRNTLGDDLIIDGRLDFDFMDTTQLIPSQLFTLPARQEKSVDGNPILVDVTPAETKVATLTATSSGQIISFLSPPTPPISPVVHLKLDESNGSDTFVNSANPDLNGRCYATFSLDEDWGYCPKVGLPGQVGQAILSTYLGNTYIAIPPSASLTPPADGEYSLSVWVNPTEVWWPSPIVKSVSDTSISTVTHETPVLALGTNRDNAYVNFCKTKVTLAPIPKNIWSQLVMTSAPDGAENRKVDVYLNGELIGSETASNDLACFEQDWGLALSGDINMYRGLIDELLVYTSTLSAQYIQDIYRYQQSNYSGELDGDFTQQTVTIDVDKPNVGVGWSTNLYFGANQERLIGFGAVDATSAVVSGEYSIDGGATWQPATGSGSSGNWLFYVQPGEVDTYTILLRATDAVGNVSDVYTLVLKIDSTPPTATLDPSLRAGVLPLAGGRSITLFGSHDDYGQSGVTSLLAQLLDKEGNAVTAPEQVLRPQYEGLNMWKYTFNLPYASQALYTSRFIVQDAAGNTAVLTETVPIRVDGRAPIADITTPSDTPITTLPALDLHLGMETFERTTLVDSSVQALPVSCVAEQCPTSVTNDRYGQGLARAFDGVDDLVTVPVDASETAYALAYWFKTTCTDCGLSSLVDGNRNGYDRILYLNNGDLCAFTYNTETICTSSPSYADGTWHHLVHTFGGNSGGQKLYVDGGLVASGNLDHSDFTWQTDLLIGYGASLATPYFAGEIDEVALYHKALSETEVRGLFTTSLLPNNPRLYLPLNETGGTQFNDASGYGFDATCTGDTCPTVGETAVFNRALRFDGVDDYIATTPDVTENLITDLTVSAWVNLENTVADGTLIPIVSSSDSAGSGGYVLGVHNGGLGVQLLLDMGQLWQPTQVVGAGQIPANTWTHIAFTFTVENIIGYINGQEVGRWNLNTIPFSPLPVPAPASVQIGHAETQLVTQQAQGLIDEVLIYERALSTSEMLALVSNHWSIPTVPAHPLTPQLYLDFDAGEENGRFGSAKSFAAADSSETHQVSGLTTESGGTIAGWVNYKTPTLGNQKIIGVIATSNFYTPLYISVGNFGALTVEQDNVLQICGTLPANGWHHFAVTFKNVGFICYVDGQQVGNGTFYPTNRLDGEYRLGAHAHDGNLERLNGLLDDVRIYDQALPAELIQRLLTIEPVNSRYLVQRLPLGVASLQGSVTDGPLTGATVFNYHFEEESGATTFADGGFTHQPATCQGATCPQAGGMGKLGQAIQFDGQDDFLSFSDSLGFGQMSVSAWVYRTGTTTERQAIVSYKEESTCGFVLSLNEDGTNYFPRIWVNVDGGWWMAEQSETFPINQWIHLAATYDGVTIRLFRDGVEVATQVAHGFMRQCNGRSAIGARSSQNQHFFPGLVDEVGIYGRPLSDLDIEGLANTDVVGVERLSIGFHDMRDTTYRLTAQPQGQIVRLALDDTNGMTFTNRISNTQIATCALPTCPTAGVAGWFDQAIRFDGQDDYLEIAHDATLNPDNELTLSAWVKLNDVGGNQKIIGKTNLVSGYALGVGGGNLYPELWDATGQLYTAQWPGVPNNVWTHLAITWETNGDLIGYINGQEVGRIATSQHPIGSNNFPIRLGAAPWSPNAFFVDGLLDEVNIYHRVLSPVEIATLVNPPTQSPQPILALPFEDTKQGDWEFPTYFQDMSGEEQIVTCTIRPFSTDCSNLKQNGIFGYAVAGAGYFRPLTVQDAIPLDLDNFTISAWVKNLNCSLPSTSELYNNLYEQTTLGFMVGVCNDQLVIKHSGEVFYFEPTTLLLNDKWWHVAFSWQTGDAVVAYVDGVEIGRFNLQNWPTSDPISAAQNSLNWQMRLQESTLLDELLVYNTALTAQDIRALANPLQWQEATLATPGNPFSAWSYELPSNLEGVYRLDLRAIDQNGRARFIPNVWQGEIDTQSPRVTMISENSGPNLLIHKLEVSDNNLRPLMENMLELGLTSGQLQPDYLDQKWARAVFGDQLQLYKFSNFDDLTGRYEPFVIERPLQDQFIVCDKYEHCTRTNTVQALPPPTVPISPFLHLSFDETYPGTTQFTDNSGLFHTAECVAPHCPTPGVPGYWGQAMQLDGVDDYVLIPSLASNWVEPPDFTAAAWINLADWSTRQTILGKSTDPIIGTEPYMGFTMQIHYNQLIIKRYSQWSSLQRVVAPLDPLPPNNSWIHVAFTWGNSEGLIVYINGQEVARNIEGGTTIPSPYPLTIGNNAGNAGYAAANGLIDELLVYERALTSTEIAQLATSNTIDLSQQRDLLTPNTHPSVSLRAPRILTDTTPRAFDLYALAPSALQAITVTVNGSTLYATSWATATVTETVATTPLWTPPGTGYYTLKAQVQDGQGVVVESVPLRLLVDTEPPALTLATTQIDATNFNENGFVLLTGSVSDNIALNELQVQINNEPWQSIAIPVLTTTWQAELQYNWSQPPNGEMVTLTVRATDRVGWETVRNRNVIAEVTLPQPFTPTLQYATVSGMRAITQSTTVYDVLNPTLTLNWTASNDSNGIVRYLAGWTTTPDPGRGEGLTVYPPDAFTHSQSVVDGQTLYAHVIAEDAYGNQRVQSIPGPLYVDYKETPVQIGLVELGEPYNGWLDNSCSLLGVDTRAEQAITEESNMAVPQKLYTNWDESGLRLTWAGADWTTDGDLFIYLDTQAGGTRHVYDPYPTTQGRTNILLPVETTGTTGRQLTHPSRLQVATQQMEADYLVWVQEKAVVVTETVTVSGTQVVLTRTDTLSATLLAWDEPSRNWQPVAGDWYYLLQTETDVPLTNIYLPFARLGITDPANTSLALVALASENDGLRLWATMPARNPVNSNRVIDSALEKNYHQFALLEQYAWPALGNNVCPNVVVDNQGNPKQAHRGAETVQYSGADMVVALTVAPVGSTYSLLNDNYYFIQETLGQFSTLVDWSAEKEAFCTQNSADTACERQFVSDSNLDFNPADHLGMVLDVDHDPLGDGQIITYTLQLRNVGVGSATGVVIDMSTWGPLTLPDGDYVATIVDGEEWEWYNQIIEVGTITAGEWVTITFTSLVDITFDPVNNEGMATLDITIYDDTGDYYDNNIDWFYVDHPIDDYPPLYMEIQNPMGLIGPNVTQFTGFVQDYSPVPTVTLQIASADSVTETVTCPQTVTSDHTWTCAWNAQGAQDGDWYSVAGRATDQFNQTGVWSRDYYAYTEFVVDALAPELNLSPDSEANVADGVLGHDESLLSGTIADNYLLDRVEVCTVGFTSSSCNIADLTLDQETVVQTTYIYTDTPTTPIPFNTTSACDGNEVVRTFTVGDDFIIADVDVGLNLNHNYRHDITAYLISPHGTEVPLLINNSEADNYDILLNDAVNLIIDDDKVNHNTAAPYYENERSAAGYLSTFNYESALGEWQLTMCDYFPEEDDGFYNHSQLILRSHTLPENTSGQWSYQLPLESEDREGIHTLALYGVDSVGNRTTPLTLTYQIDTIAPLITVTTQPNGSFFSFITPILAGTASDNNSVASMELLLLTPDKEMTSYPLYFDGLHWSVYIQTVRLTIPGTYQLWVTAVDQAGNETIAGAFTAVSTGYYTLYFPVILQDWTSESHPLPE